MLTPSWHQKKTFGVLNITIFRTVGVSKLNYLQCSCSCCCSSSCSSSSFPFLPAGYQLYPNRFAYFIAASHVLSAGFCLWVWLKSVMPSPRPISGQYLPRVLAMKVQVDQTACPGWEGRESLIRESSPPATNGLVD